MTVGDLMAFLEKHPHDMIIGFSRYSEYEVLEESDIEIVEACKPRPDNWIQRKRPDMPVQKYLMFPGN